VQAISAWRAAQIPAAGSGGTASKEGGGWLHGIGAAVMTMSEDGGAGGRDRCSENVGGGQQAQGGWRKGGINGALKVAAIAVGAYEPVGSFRFIYSIAHHASSPGELAAGERETKGRVQNKERMAWKIHLEKRQTANKNGNTQKYKGVELAGDGS